MKKIYLILCMALIMFGATACKKEDNINSVTFDEATLANSATALAENIANEENIAQIADEDIYTDFSATYGEEIASSYKSFYDTSKDLGDYISTSVTETTISGDTASVELVLKYTDDTIVMKCIFDKKSQLTSFSSDIYHTLGDKMLKALLNTVMGMGTVFVVLIFISYIIALLKYVPKLLSKEKKTISAPVSEPVVSIPEEEELVDDGELVAVITAAIMASLGDQAPEDGLVVRSIRKINKKWKNA